MTLRAEKRNDRYVLNGTKMWITNGPDADTLVVYAKTDPERAARHHRLPGRARLKGFSVAQKLDKLGMRGSNTGELVFEDSRCRRRTCWARKAAACEVLMSGLDYERVVLAGGPIGIMAACLDLVVPYIHERRQFGQAIGEFQLIQGKVADMYSTMNASARLCLCRGRACDRGRTSRKDAAGCHPVCGREAATKAALDAIQICWAATAISTTIPPAGCCATPSSTRSAPAPARSGAG
jgi:isovaleryl-CoA dehydrogenase